MNTKLVWLILAALALVAARAEAAEAADQADLFRTPNQALRIINGTEHFIADLPQVTGYFQENLPDGAVIRQLVTNQVELVRTTEVRPGETVSRKEMETEEVLGNLIFIRNAKLSAAVGQRVWVPAVSTGRTTVQGISMDAYDAGTPKIVQVQASTRTGKPRVYPDLPPRPERQEQRWRNEEPPPARVHASAQDDYAYILTNLGPAAREKYRAGLRFSMWPTLAEVEQRHSRLMARP